MYNIVHIGDARGAMLRGRAGCLIKKRNNGQVGGRR